MRPTTLGVIGLGAIGGSVAWQAARAGIPRVVGYTTHPPDGAAALRAGAVTELARDPVSVAQHADFLVLAAPPEPTLELLRAVADTVSDRRAYCTDVTSVKAPVMALAQELALAPVFAGSHPFAGTHESGFRAARPDRFAGQVVYVTPLEDGERAAREVADFWQRVLGAEVVTVSAGRHDAVLARTSHLPQAVASALAVALARHGPDGARYGSGALSTTRLAASNAALWTEVLLLNRDHVCDALTEFDAGLVELREALTAGDAGRVRHWLETGLAWRSRHRT